MDFNRKFDTYIDFITYSGCKLAIKNMLRNSVFDAHNNNVTNVTTCLQKLYSTNKCCKLYYDILNEKYVNLIFSFFFFFFVVVVDVTISSTTIISCILLFLISVVNVFGMGR